MICLGTMNFGTTVEVGTAFRLLDQFVDAGGVDVDTANCYASWIGSGDESELTLGRWCRSRRARHRVRLASKVGARPAEPGSPRSEGLAPAVVRAAVDDSLRRLGTDHLDVCFAHQMDDAVPLEETLGAFEALVRAGRTRAVGLSNHTVDSLRSALSVAATREWTPVTWLQQRHSYLQPLPGASFGPQIALDPAMERYAATVPGLRVQGYSPLLSGAYTRADRQLWPHYRHPGNDARYSTLREVADELGVSANQVVLAWMLASRPSVQPVVGVSSPEQLDECLAATRLELNADQLRRLGGPG